MMRWVSCYVPGGERRRKEKRAKFDGLCDLPPGVHVSEKRGTARETQVALASKFNI